jgi:pyruvate/2-oxoglutarate dehydrogenase complex dihydrolipoamide dehydrogenase (E3) component
LIDVVIIGGGYAGYTIADTCSNSSLKPLIIEECCLKPEHWEGEWIKGHGTVSGTGLVAVLDPATGDELRLVHCKAIVLAVGRLDSGQATARMIGAAKLGVKVNAEGTAFITDKTGRTAAPGIFATGSCSSSFTPYLADELVRYCNATVTGKAS